MAECFKIRIHQIDDEKRLFDLKSGHGILQVPCLKPYFKLNPITIVADPFLFVRNDTLYLFYESKKWLSPGVLMMVSTNDLKKWSKPKVVLKEHYHLSFPWVFEHNGRVFMMPETGAANSIRLYEAQNDDLSEFAFVKELLRAPDGVEICMGYGDSCIYHKGDIFYLFTQLQYSNRINTLELYIAKDLFGPYHKHPKSPVQHNQKVGRNAGSLMEYCGQLFRFSQDCTGRYGDNVSINLVDSISPTDYKEHLLFDNIIPTDIPYYKDGGHHFNAVKFHEKWIVATDAKEYHKLPVQRLFNRIKRILS